ncbi:MAG: FG-GAP repeat domain-containing protein [Pyrinomonadaceae bacterium]
MKLTAIALLIFSSCNAGALQGSLFRPRVVIPLPNKPSNLALADLNKDGRLDLIVASEEGRTVEVMFGQQGDVPFRVATGSAAAGPTSSAAAQTVRLPEGTESPGELVLGDVNGDGRLDLAWDFHDSYNVTLLLGNANGGFALAPNSPIVMKQGQHPHTHGLGIGDLNGDGKLDLASVNNADNDISVALGDGRGGFTNAPRSPFAVGPSPYPLTIGDVNNDGRLDIVSNATATGPNRAQQLPLSRALTLLLNDGQGGFRRSEVPLRTMTPWSTAMGDINGDGKPDLVATHHDQSKLTVLIGDGTGGFREVAGSPFEMGRNVWRTTLADVNHDRRLDVIAAGGDSVRVMLGDGAGSFRPAPHSPFVTGAGTWRLAVGDINQDGKTDIVTSNTDNRSVTILFGV